MLTHVDAWWKMKIKFVLYKKYFNLLSNAIWILTRTNKNKLRQNLARHVFIFYKHHNFIFDLFICNKRDNCFFWKDDNQNCASNLNVEATANNRLNFGYHRKQQKMTVMTQVKILININVLSLLRSINFFYEKNKLAII